MCVYCCGGGDSIGVGGGDNLQETEMLLEVDNHDDDRVDEAVNVLSEQKGLVTYAV